MRLTETPALKSMPRVFRPERAAPADAVRPTRAEVNLANLRHNFHLIKSKVGSVPIWCVLKADGYGHGSKALARTLERAGADGVCVALLEEGIELREAGIRMPILVMGGHYGRAYSELLRHDLTPVLQDRGQLEALAEEVRYRNCAPVRVHVKVDTGMGRLGLTADAVNRFGESLRDHPEVVFDGLMTHFACADDPSQGTTERQLALFRECLAGLKKLGLAPRVRHAANSAALLTSQDTHLDLVRPGIAVFGVEPFPGACPGLRPVMSVRSEIVSLRDLAEGASVGYGWTFEAKRPTRVATIPMGYADGLARQLSNRGRLLVRGSYVPIIGVVSMDMAMLDVTDVADVQVGDECVVLGTQRGVNGEVRVTASELANDVGTIPWDVLTSISRRVPRFYREP